MVEPSAELLNCAHRMYECYVAYLRSGFTEDQAMRLLVAQVSAALKPPADG